MGLSDIALQVANGNVSNSDPADIITFVESDWGLNTELYPVQRVILKAHYGVPLDDTKSNIEVTDWRKENLRLMTEAEYLRYLYDEGRCNISEVIPGQERRRMILSIGRRSGKCILGDSLVLTDKGIRRIEDLAVIEGVGPHPLDVGVVQEGGKLARSDFHYSGGIRDVRVLTTHCGYQLGGTHNHRIKVLTEQGVVDWKYLSDIGPGDVVCLHRNTNLWASDPVDCTPFHNDIGDKDLTPPNQLDEIWGRMFGHLVGGGIWDYKDRVEIAVEHPETWETLKGLFTKLFGSYSVCAGEHREGTGSIKFVSAELRRFLHDLGLRLGTDQDSKRVPWSVLQSPLPVVQAFLRGLFESGGGVEAEGKAVSLRTASGRLAREVQTLLLNLGIVSRVHSKPTNGRVYWTLIVRGRRSRRAFVEQVWFDSHKKRGPLLASFDSGREWDSTESIPHQRTWCRRLLESLPEAPPCPDQKQAWSKLREELGNMIKPGAPDGMTYSRLARVLSAAEEIGADPGVVQHFRHLEGLDYFYDLVEHVEEGHEPVYDLSVPDGHQFVANGMTNHNTFISACIAAYEVYKLVLKGDPQRYYGVTSDIGFVSVATGKEQAGLLYNEASNFFAKCAFFHPYTANNTQTYAKFQSPRDIQKFGRYKDDPAAKASIKVTFASCIAKGLRGPGNMLVIFDELAHFNTVGQSDAKTVWDAVTPSVATFSPKHPDNKTLSLGPVEGRIIAISSPLGRQGFFYEQFQLGFTGGKVSKEMLCVQAPTWEVNPTIPDTWFEVEYASDASKFFTEYGADFADQSRNWIENEDDLLSCVDPALRPRQSAPSRMPHFAGIDLGLVDDGTALSIGHLGEDQRIVLDYVGQIKAGEGDYADDERLEFDDVADWVYSMSRKFYIVEGMFDMWAGIPFEQALLKRGLRQFKAEHMTRNRNSEIWRNFKDMMWDQRIVLYDWPIVGQESHCEYIQELLDLVATYHSKYITTVEAPNIKGKHDDRSDALARMIWLASRNLGKPKYISKRTSRGSQKGAQRGVSNGSIRRALLKAKQGGSSPERRVPRMGRRGRRF